MARIAYFCNDLLFTSKIRETARHLGHDVAPARDLDGFLAAARGADLAIVDLRLPDALAALGRLADPRPHTIGFCDHERTELMEDARRAGCEKVLTKGKFSSDLKHLLS